MQRIYLDGKENLENFIPDDWAKPNKIMNHRSAKRIVELANSIRKNVDGKAQKYRADASEGNIMLFICDKNLYDQYCAVLEFMVKNQSETASRILRTL